MQEREVALAQGDQVAAGAEVRLGADRLAVARDREAQIGLLARAGVAGVEAHVVAAVAQCGRRGRGQVLEVGDAVDAQVARERLGLAVVREVGEQAVGAGGVERAPARSSCRRRPARGAGAESRSGRGGRG